MKEFMDISNKLLESVSILAPVKEEPLSATELQFDLWKNPEKYQDFNDAAMYEFIDRYKHDEYQQLYWVRKSVIKVCREKKLSNRAAKWYADRNASNILDALKEKRYAS